MAADKDWSSIVVVSSRHSRVSIRGTPGRAHLQAMVVAMAGEEGWAFDRCSIILPSLCRGVVALVLLMVRGSMRTGATVVIVRSSPVQAVLRNDSRKLLGQQGIRGLMKGRIAMSVCQVGQLLLRGR
jgi:hypothetical protein